MSDNERMIPDGHGNMINERFQQIMEELENRHFNEFGKDPDEPQYSVLESQASDLFEDGYQPIAPTAEEENRMQQAREQLGRLMRYEEIQKSYGSEGAYHAQRLDNEIDESMIPAKDATQVRPYRVEVKATRAPGMPGGRTWSIKQKFED